MIKGVIFDLDGVLIDSEMVYYRLDKELLDEFGIDFPLSIYTNQFSGRTWKENIYHLVNDFSLPISEEEAFRKIKINELKYFNEKLEQKDGARKILQSLKERGIKIALATSSTKDMGLMKLKASGIDIEFDAYCFGDDIEKGKPEPDIFLLAKDRLGLKKEECVVIEDSENGILAAHNASIKVICIPDLKVPSKEILNLCHKTLKNINLLDNFIKSAM